ncbi:hypothetical protein EYF80_039552 [Liparis tanakae]|uniref:Uncharacterized protein n=1 Tax=Liparis tanakae TaxID=230148 RepID=A0A4Z2G9N8_9TELE|nr:hypothetical protein EYF80_039552 [Liparis tanakae]
MTERKKVNVHLQYGDGDGDRGLSVLKDYRTSTRDEVEPRGRRGDGQQPIGLIAGVHSQHRLAALSIQGSVTCHHNTWGTNSEGDVRFALIGQEHNRIQEGNEVPPLGRPAHPGGSVRWTHLPHQAPLAQDGERDGRVSFSQADGPRHIREYENAVRVVAGEHSQSGRCSDSQTAVGDVNQGHAESLVELRDVVLGHVDDDVLRRLTHTEELHSKDLLQLRDRVVDNGHRDELGPLSGKKVQHAL